MGRVVQLIPGHVHLVVNAPSVNHLAFGMVQLTPGHAYRVVCAPLVNRVAGVALHRQVAERSAHLSDHFDVAWERDWGVVAQRAAYPVLHAELDNLRP